MLPKTDPMQLGGRTFLVTGASAGIGRATATVIASLGGRVIASGRDKGRLEETVEKLAGHGHGISAFDLGEMNEIPMWIKDICRTFGPLNGLAHCAGIQLTQPIRQIDQQFFDQMMRTNLGSAIALARGFRQKGCNTTPAAMVFVASIAGLIGQPGNVAYAASKGGLISAVRALAMELLRDDIRVNAVAPALVETEMASRSRATMTAEQYQYMLDQHPMGIGQPLDVAYPIAFLLSDASRWINAVTLPVEGGYLAR